MELLLQHCQAFISSQNGVVITLFMAGLVGSATHCVGMCGPFVAAGVKPSESGAPIFQRVKGAALLPYHVGRMTTYMFLGMISAYLSRYIIATPYGKWATLIMLSLAGMLFILAAFPALKQPLTFPSVRFFGGAKQIISQFTKPLMNQHSSTDHYIMGVMLGFIPCGLLFASLMLAATVAQPLTAALGMMAFSLGTFPALFGVGLGSHYVRSRWPHGTHNLVRVLLVCNGIGLFAIASTIFTSA